MQNTKKVLICPLNWGLGHATRDIPIIKAFLNNGFEVVMAASGASFLYLKREFPNMQLINFPGYKVRYSKNRSQVLRMFFLVPAILFWTMKEHWMLKKMVRNYEIDIVISDNRFGLWNKQTYNVFITHQLHVKFPGLLKVFEPVYQKFSNFIINKYHECWIPDFSGDDNLSGELSHNNNKIEKLCYINPLSRFSVQNNTKSQKDIDVLFILSGPEPQRSILEKIIVKHGSTFKLRLMMVRGTSKVPEAHINFPFIDLANSKQLFDLIKKAKLVVSRSGYSSVMDLFVLKQKAVLIPTPGQTEQEYLANYLFKKKFFYSMAQEEFNLEQAIEKAIGFPETKYDGNELLQERILLLNK